MATEDSKIDEQDVKIVSNNFSKFLNHQELKLKFQRVNKDPNVSKALICRGDLKKSPPPVLSRVFLHLEGRLADGTLFLDSLVEEFDCLVGQATLPSGLEMALVAMLPGEECMIICRPGAGYNSVRRPANVSADDTLYMYVTLIRWEKEKNIPDMSANERLDYVRERRAIGKELFISGKSASAAKQYERALLVLQTGLGGRSDMKLVSNEAMQKVNHQVSLTRAMEAEKDELIKLNLLNLSACELKLEQYSRVITTCTKVLRLDDSETKAWFRRGKAHLLREEYDQAAENLKKVQALSQDVKVLRIVSRMLETVTKQKRLKQKAQAKVFGGIFGANGASLYADKPMAATTSAPSMPSSATTATESIWLRALGDMVRPCYSGCAQVAAAFSQLLCPPHANPIVSKKDK